MCVCALRAPNHPFSPPSAQHTSHAIWRGVFSLAVARKKIKIHIMEFYKSTMINFDLCFHGCWVCVCVCDVRLSVSCVCCDKNWFLKVENPIFIKQYHRINISYSHTLSTASSLHIYKIPLKLGETPSHSHRVAAIFHETRVAEKKNKKTTITFHFISFFF